VAHCTPLHAHDTALPAGHELRPVTPEVASSSFVDPAIFIVAAMDAEEANVYSSKDTCTKEVSAAIARVNKKYHEAVAQTKKSKH